MIRLQNEKHCQAGTGGVNAACDSYISPSICWVSNQMMDIIKDRKVSAGRQDRLPSALFQALDGSRRTAWMASFDKLTKRL
jgi:hypothetical protein